MSKFENIPYDVFEEIAFQLVKSDNDILGPPSQLVPLFCTSRTLNRCLSMDYNPTLYARIFKHKFDHLQASRRLIGHSLVASAMANELRLRCRVLKYFRGGSGCIVEAGSSVDQEEKETVQQVLWTAYLMVLENEGKNIRHLSSYARIKPWISKYLFDITGASLLQQEISQRRWPQGSASVCLAMWLMWFFLEYDPIQLSALRILKIFSLGAHRYPPSTIPWHQFSTSLRDAESPSSTVIYYGGSRAFVAPCLVPPAILAFLSLINSNQQFLSHPLLTLSFPTRSDEHSTELHLGSRWEAEWNRSLPSTERSWVNGSIDGVWEGAFTYMDFNDFADLRHDAPPTRLQDSFIAQHEQLWTLREFHLLEDDCAEDGLEPIPYGDPLSAFFPSGCHIYDNATHLELREPGKPNSIKYVRWNSTLPLNRSLDVIVAGQGHSNWGRFNLRGRVRKKDGFVSLLKEYSDGPRGRWVYRGYVIGHPEGNLVGRWRDTITPTTDYGYEGCFGLTRRR